MSILGLTPGPWDPSASGSDATDASAGWDLAGGFTIASWGRRLAAYAVDVLVISAIQSVFAVTGHPLPTGILAWQAVLAGTLLLVRYMTVSQVFTHHTIGKYILGIQVVNDHAQAGIPSLGRIVLRETVGRIASMQLLLGYWFARHDPKRQAWSDQMADTVVVMRDTNPYLRRALIAGAAVFFCGAWVSVGYTGILKQRKAAALAQQIRLVGPAVDQLGLKIERLRRQGQTLADLQENNRKVLPLLDQYDQGLRQMQGKILALLQQKLVTPAGAAVFQRALASCATLLERSAVERQQAELILSFKPGTPPQTIRSEMAPLNAKIVQLGMQLAAQQAALRTGNRAPRPTTWPPAIAPPSRWSAVPGAAARQK